MREVNVNCGHNQNTVGACTMRGCPNCPETYAGCSGCGSKDAEIEALRSRLETVLPLVGRKQEALESAETELSAIRTALGASGDLVAAAKAVVTERDEALSDEAVSANTVKGLAAGLTMTCSRCAKPATCVGEYEGHGGFEPACDECCGHGNEDGICVELQNHRAETLQSQLVEVSKALGSPKGCLVEAATRARGIEDAAKDFEKFAWNYACALVCKDPPTPGQNTMRDFTDARDRLRKALDAALGGAK